MIYFHLGTFYDSFKFVLFYKEEKGSMHFNIFSPFVLYQCLIWLQAEMVKMKQNWIE